MNDICITVNIVASALTMREKIEYQYVIQLNEQLNLMGGQDRKGVLFNTKMLIQPTTFSCLMHRLQKGYCTGTLIKKVHGSAILFGRMILNKFFSKFFFVYLVMIISDRMFQLFYLLLIEKLCFINYHYISICIYIQACIPEK